MLHEVLLALTGITGDVVKCTSDRRGFCIASDIRFLEASECANLHKLCSLGSMYQKISQRCKYIVDVCASSGVPVNSSFAHVHDILFDELPNSGDKLSGGLYFRAFTCGLEKVLLEYRSRVVAIESSILTFKNNPFPLAKIFDLLSDFSLVFPVIINLTEQLIREAFRFSGSAMLDLLSQFRSQQTGPSAIAIDCVVRSCYDVLWNQASSWMLHGQLIDPFDEFFIQRSSVHPQNRSVDLPFESDSAIDWSFEFSLLLPNLPLSIISFELAHSILFTGKAVRVLGGNLRSQLPQFQEVGFSCIPSEDAKAIAELLQCLRENPFVESMVLHQIIQQIQHCVASHLWNRIVAHADLPAYLKAMKDYFLLSRGEFYQILIEEGNGVMVLPPSNRAERDMNEGPFQSAAHKCGVEDDALFRLFRLKLHCSNFNLNFAKQKGRPGLDVKSDSQSLASHFHSDVNLIGSAQWIAQSILLVPATSAQVGACWFADQMQVDRGFRSQFQFSVDSDNVEGFAFVLQNHSHRCIGEGGVGLGYAGLPNCIAVQFKFLSQQEVSNHDAKSQISIQTGWAQSNSALPKYSIGSQFSQLDLRDSQKHIALVEIQNGIIKIFVDNLNVGAEICSANVDIFRIKPEAGRVWLGLTASTSKSSSIAHHSGSAGFSLFSWSFSDSGSSPHSGHAWRQLGLECNVASPVNLIFRPDVLTRYDSLFRFLFGVKRVQHGLQQCWMVLKNTRKFAWRLHSVYRILFSLRARMQFFVDNLQYYLQVDVLEVQFSQLVKSLSKSHDFESVRKAHDVYLGNLTQDCFLLHKQLLRSFEHIFECCSTLCQIVFDHADSSEWSPESIQSIIRIEQDFKMQTSFVYVILSTATAGSASHVGQLLLRLDFNKYFSSMTHQPEDEHR